MDAALQGSQYCNASYISLHIINIIQCLNWKSVVIIHDTEHEGLQLPFVKQQRYHVDQDYQYTRDMLRTIHASMSPEINLIIAASPPLTLSLVREMDTFDFLTNGTTDFRHDSKMVLMAPDQRFLQTLEARIHHLNNVVAILTGGDNCRTREGHGILATLHNIPSGRVFVSVPQNTSAFTWTLAKLFPNTEYGYNNRHITVSTVHSLPYLIKSTVNGTTTYKGYAIDIWKLMATTLNFSYEFLEVEDRQWGFIVNGSWNGLVGQLVRREVDIAVADLTVTLERSKTIDFVYPAIKVEDNDIIYRRGRPSEGGVFQLMKPLHVLVYVAFVSACVGTLALFIFFENTNLHVTLDVKRTHFLWSVSKYSWELGGSMLKQGFLRTPKTYSGKVLLSFWWLLVLLITSAYSANLIAALSSPPREFTLSSMDELTDSDYTVGMFELGLLYDAMKSTKRPNERRLFDKMLRDSQDDSGIFHNDEAKHMARVKEGRYAYLVYRSAGEMYIREDCRLSLIGEQMGIVGDSLHFGLPKRSPLKSELNRMMTYMHERGILGRLWKKQLKTTSYNNSKCAVDRTTKTMSLRELGGGFMVVSGGVALSLVVLVVEISWTRVWNCL